MDWAPIVTVTIGGVVSFAGAVLSWRSARGANETTQRVARDQIEAGAYERSRQHYEATLGRLDSEITRQAAQVNNQAAQIQGQAQEIRTLKRQLFVLIRQVRDAGLVPAISEEDL